MTSLNSFPIFGKLPQEVRNMVFRAAADNEDSNIVEVEFIRTPTIRRKGHPRNSRRPRSIVWIYSCTPYHVSPLLSTSKESRAEYLLRHPHTLQLNRGTPVVHFNAARDTIYFDAESLFNFWHYITRHRARPTKILTRNLKGFQAVQVLGSYFPGTSTVHNNGLADVRVPVERALTNLQRIRCLGARGVHPGGWDPATIMPPNQRPLPRRLRRALIQLLDDFENGMQFPGHPQRARTVAQRDRIEDARDDVDVDVDDFFAPALGVVGIPVSQG
jgi:2EXR family